MCYADAALSPVSELCAQCSLQQQIVRVYFLSEHLAYVPVTKQDCESAIRSQAQGKGNLFTLVFDTSRCPLYATKSTHYQDSIA
jgi:hypothetical protein